MLAVLQWCYQCEQTLNREGCYNVGVCGKTPEVSVSVSAFCMQ